MTDMTDMPDKLAEAIERVRDGRAPREERVRFLLQEHVRLWHNCDQCRTFRRVLDALLR